MLRVGLALDQAKEGELLEIVLGRFEHGPADFVVLLNIAKIVLQMIVTRDFLQLIFEDEYFSCYGKAYFEIGQHPCLTIEGEILLTTDKVIERYLK